MLLRVLLRLFQSGMDTVNVGLRRSNAPRRFLLENVQHIKPLSKVHDIHRSIGIALVTYAYLPDGVPETLQRFN
jgi:hypothetical protein